MLSIQEILDKTVIQRKNIRHALNAVTESSGWHPEDASLYAGLKSADEYEIRETMKQLNLAEILAFASSNTGADDLVAAKLHDTLIYAARDYDIAPQIGYVVNKWEGGNLKVQVTVDGSYTPKPFVSGGKLNEVNASFVYAELKPEAYGIPILAGADMIDDQEYGIIQWHVEKAAAATAQKSSQLALAALIAASDGDGTLNSGNSGDAANTKWTGASTTGIDTAYIANGVDNFKSDSIITTTTSWADSIYSTIPAGTVVSAATKPTFDFNVAGLNVMIWHNAADLTSAASKLMTMVFDSKNALLTGRKRWMEIKNFSNPMEDIAGAVVSFRQDSVTLYRDAVFKITET
jgi:hypothetical protein